MSTQSSHRFAYYVIIAALGLTLSSLVYVTGNSVVTTTSNLVNIDLPLQENISKLRFAIFAQKPVLYEYYANTDRDTFQKSFNESKNTIKAGLYMIPRNEEGQSFLTQIEFHTGQLTHLGEQLDQTLNSNSINWDKARDILVEVSATENKITPLIDTFVALNQKHVTSLGELAKSRTLYIIYLVIGFSLIMLVLSILLGRQFNSVQDGK